MCYKRSLLFICLFALNKVKCRLEVYKNNNFVIVLDTMLP